MTHFTSQKLLGKVVAATIFIAIYSINTPAKAQIIRNFPDAAVRGNIAFKTPPHIVVDGNTEKLTVGARIRDERNMLVLTGMLMGKEFIVNFKREASTGQVHDVWILSAEETKVKLAGEKK